MDFFYKAIVWCSMSNIAYFNFSFCYEFEGEKNWFWKAAVECNKRFQKDSDHELNSSLQWPVEPSGHSLHFDIIYEGAAPVVSVHLCQNGQSCMKAQQLTDPAPLCRGRLSAVAMSAVHESYKEGSSTQT